MTTCVYPSSLQMHLRPTDSAVTLCGRDATGWTLTGMAHWHAAVNAGRACKRCAEAVKDKERGLFAEVT